MVAPECVCLYGGVNVLRLKKAVTVYVRYSIRFISVFTVKVVSLCYHFISAVKCSLLSIANPFFFLKAC